MLEYGLTFSKYLKKDNYITYDVISYDSKFYCGIDLFRNFNYFLQKKWDSSVIVYNDYAKAENHFLNQH